MICGVGAIVIMILLMCAGLVRMRPVLEEMQGSESSPEAFEREIERIGEEMADSPGFYVGTIVFTGLALVGTILAIVGLTRSNARKGQAVAGLVICGSFMSCQCGLVLVQLMAAGAG